ncbi:MAG: Rrf2 family transcriptional regulator [Zetaproteobacteria bacterium]|nr:Rrf2 family transcriptional regulator [Zetaproteobacteria bacterium]
MNFTAKSRYALKMMLDLADHQNEGPQKRHDIAMRQSIPIDFMDQILIRLRENGLIVSVRGRSGGLKLNRCADVISLWEIFYAVEDNVYPVKCLTNNDCKLEHTCISVEAWADVIHMFKDNLSQKSLKATLEKWQARQRQLQHPNSSPTVQNSGTPIPCS